MKVKFSFVTNSSSTAYIVFIPDNFKASRKDIMDIYSEELEGYYDELNEDDIVKEINEKIEDLKFGETIWEYDEYMAYAIIRGLCSYHDFILTSLDVSSDGNGTITNIKKEKFIDILVSHDNLDDVMKPFIKCEEK